MEKGAEARWDNEKDNPVYFADKDEMHIAAHSVGDKTEISDFNAIINVTPPGTKAKAIKVKLGKPVGDHPTGQGLAYDVVIPSFKKKFPTLDAKGKPVADPKIEDYLIEGKFDDELGTDFMKSKPIIA